MRRRRDTHHRHLEHGRDNTIQYQKEWVANITARNIDSSISPLTSSVMSSTPVPAEGSTVV